MCSMKTNHSLLLFCLRVSIHQDSTWLQQSRGNSSQPPRGQLVLRGSLQGGSGPLYDCPTSYRFALSVWKLTPSPSRLAWLAADEWIPYRLKELYEFGSMYVWLKSRMANGGSKRHDVQIALIDRTHPLRRTHTHTETIGHGQSIGVQVFAWQTPHTLCANINHAKELWTGLDRPKDTSRHSYLLFFGWWEFARSRVYVCVEDQV